ncbi:hypothetical protein BT69DRAFT_1345539, partial [Atractiella rhizophila]
MESEEFEEPPLPEVESEPLGLEDLEPVDAVGIDAEPGLDAALGDPLTGPGDVIVDEEEGSAMVLLKSYTTLDFLIGLFITLGASILNALGLNLVKLSHKQSESSRNRSSFRPLAILGLLLYILSQLVGSTLALSYLRAEWVAPLGSTSLIFNFIFANLLVGTKITRTDIVGTLTIVVGVVGVVLFSQMRRGAIDVESNLSLSTLKDLWARSGWITYLIFLESATITLFWLATIGDEVLFESQRMETLPTIVESDSETETQTNGGRRRLDVAMEKKSLADRAKMVLEWGKKGKKRARRVRRNVKARFEGWSMRQQEITVKKTVGFLWAATGGLLAGQSLVFAKSAVKLVSA